MRGVSLCFASRSSYNTYIIASGFRQNCLCYESFFTYRAFLAIRQTCCRASGGCTDNGFFGMRQFVNRLLLNRNCSANRAFLSFGQTFFRTGSRNAKECGFCMRQFIGGLLCFQNRIANRAFFALCQAVFATSGSNCRDDLFGVICQCSFGLSQQHLVTN